MPRTVETYPANTWFIDSFWKFVARHEREEAHVAAAYDRPIDTQAIRHQVLDAILSHAIPAGNA